jgi:small-conductance mechanosensitive channel
MNGGKVRFPEQSTMKNGTSSSGATKKSARFTRLAWVFLAAVILSPALEAQQAGPAQAIQPAQIRSAPVIIDGKQLFVLRGLSAFPAEQRAALVRERIIALAQDESYDPNDLTVVEKEDHLEFMANEERVFAIFEGDAQFENVSLPLLATIYRQRIIVAVNQYREDRSSPVLIQGGLYTLGVTALLIALLWVTQRLFRWLLNWSQQHVQRGVEELASKSHQLIQAGPVWSVITGLLRLVRTVIYLMLAYFYLNTVLGLFPWTRPVARILFKLILDPLASLWIGFMGSLPSLAFLVVLWFVVRYLLRLIRAFFSAVERGRIQMESFDREWAMPTYKIVRLAVIAFALVIAYPYIPGSDSMAFKGVSVFAGVLLSLGSSSFIANSIAGLSMTYRAAFREGDRIRVGDVVGTVEEIKLMVTRVRTPKNEYVVMPNSNILNTDVVNYTQMARKDGLILHTEVGIGYDTPWRQVEAMLKMAADRTGAVLKDPPPFVLQKSLGDFAVIYELNAYTRDEMRMPQTYSALHANIQDVFNEHGVQIMSPAYETDPDAPKIVPPDKWFEAPATKSD